MSIFGPAASFDEAEAILCWYDHLFKNVVNDFEHSNPVRLFVMGVNQRCGSSKLRALQFARLHVIGPGAIGRLGWPKETYPSETNQRTTAHWDMLLGTGGQTRHPPGLLNCRDSLRCRHVTMVQSAQPRP